HARLVRHLLDRRLLARRDEMRHGDGPDGEGQHDEQVKEDRVIGCEAEIHGPISAGNFVKKGTKWIINKPRRIVEGKPREGRAWGVIRGAARGGKGKALASNRPSAPGEEAANTVGSRHQERRRAAWRI